jgi:NTP pyrophosphatase (non-canonical NTP hydrolase)
MMTREQYLFGKLAEECAELAQEAIKCQQFGVTHLFGNAQGVTNIERLNGEFNDVLGVVALLNDGISEDYQTGDTAIYADIDLIDAKEAKVNKWYDVAKAMGNVT